MQRPKSPLRTIVCLSVCWIQVSAHSSDDVLNRVEISSFKGPELRSYAQLKKGLTAFKEYQKLAPNSELYFILIPKTKEVQTEGVTMRLASDEQSMVIPIVDGNKFQLPDLELKSEDEYDLILNRHKGQFYIRPYVKSPNLPSNAKRLGDLRLECQVRWAVEKQDVSIVFSSYVKLFASGNPCTSGAVSVGFFAPLGLNKIIVDEPYGKYSTDVKYDQRYYLPLEKKEIGDEVLIRYESN